MLQKFIIFASIKLYINSARASGRSVSAIRVKGLRCFPFQEMIPRNMRQPREAPAWLKHDKQAWDVWAG